MSYTNGLEYSRITAGKSAGKIQFGYQNPFSMDEDRDLRKMYPSSAGSRLFWLSPGVCLACALPVLFISRLGLVQDAEKILSQARDKTDCVLRDVALIQ